MRALGAVLEAQWEKGVPVSGILLSLALFVTAVLLVVGVVRW